MKTKLLSTIVLIVLLLNIISLNIVANAETDVSLLKELNIMNGYEDGNFHLERNVTRAEFIKMIIAASEYADTTPDNIAISPFNDVDSKYWGASYIYAGAINGLISGYPDGTFKPDANIKYEECLTVVLKLLGYTDEDFGLSWPNGQVSIANKLSLGLGVNCVVGQYMTREDVANLISNLLVSKTKNDENYIEKLDYKLIENVEIISCDSNGDILTNNGSYSCKAEFNGGIIGAKGKLIANKYDEIVGFVATEKSNSRVVSYQVESVIGDTVVTYINGVRNELFISDNTVAYKDDTKTTFANLKQSIEEGDTLSVKYNDNGSVQFVTLNSIGSSYLTEATLTRYVIYSTLNDSVLVYDNGNMKKIEIPDATVAYKDKEKTTFGSIKGEFNMGDILNVKYKDNSKISYISYEEGEFGEPETVLSQSYLNKYPDNITVYRNGVKVEKSEVEIYDIVYYLADLNMVFAYSDKITGVYQYASPNSDTPSKVTVSGVEYDIEGINAFQKLSSTGTYSYGDTVVLLLGKTGQVADVVSTSEQSKTDIVGYVIETGSKDYKNNVGEKYSSHYAIIVTPDGKEQEYTSNKKLDSYKSSVVNVKFVDGNASFTKVNSKNTKVSGKVSIDNRTIGKSDLSSNVKIIDVATTDTWRASKWCKVYLQRLDGVTIDSNSILYYDFDSKGRVDTLVLKNVTGDMFDYGIVTKAKNVSNEYVMAGTYTYDIKGVKYDLQTDNVLYSVQSGSPAKFTIEDGEVQGMSSISAVNGNVTSITYDSVVTSSGTYLLSSNVSVYKKSYSSDYQYIPFSELMEDPTKYRITAYYDKSIKSGGAVRVLVASEK